jgi:hypothetical protein
MSAGDGTQVQPRKPNTQGYWRNARNIENWIKDGGKVEETSEGGLKYTDKFGNSVTYDENGIADFSRYMTSKTGLKEIEVKGLTGDQKIDKGLADAEAFKRTGIKDFGDYTWHHVPGTTDKMQLVETAIHQKFTHKGSASEIRGGK